MSYEDAISTSRLMCYAITRHAAALVLKQERDRSRAQIGRAVNRHKGSISNSINAGAGLEQTNAGFAKIVARLRRLARKRGVHVIIPSRINQMAA